MVIKRRNYPIDKREESLLLQLSSPQLPWTSRLGRSFFRCVLSLLAVPFVIVWTSFLCILHTGVLLLKIVCNRIIILDRDRYPPPRVSLPFAGLSVLLPMLNLIEFLCIFLCLESILYHMINWPINIR